MISFVALAALWPKPRLEGARRGGRCPAARVLGSQARWRSLCGAIGVALLVIVVLLAGYVGSGVALDNFAPTFILITFWVGLVFASAIFGDVFTRLQPVARDRPRCCRRKGLRPYPEKLGRWPAAVGPADLHLDRAGLGLGRGPGAARHRRARLHRAHAGRPGRLGRRDAGPATARRSPSTTACSRGSRRSRRASASSACARRSSGLPRLDPVTGTVALVSVMIGTVTFDGLSQGRLWKDLAIDLTDVVTSARDPDHRRAAGSSRRSGSSLCVAARRALLPRRHRGRALGRRRHRRRTRLRRAFVHSLVPIAMVYVAAHYLTFLLFEGQAIRYLASDPFGQGWDLFGTASAAIDYSLLSQNGAWYAQVAFVVARPRRGADPRPRPRARALRRPEAGRALAVLDARDHGRLHHARAVAAGPGRRLAAQPLS